MSTHAHRCSLDNSHSGPCVCVCGAVVETIRAVNYAWVWRRADGRADDFPGRSWRPRSLEVGTNAGRLSR